MSQLDFIVTPVEGGDLGALATELRTELGRLQATSTQIEDVDVLEQRGEQYRSGIAEIVPELAVALVMLQGTAQVTGSVKTILDNVDAIVRRLRGGPTVKVDVDGEHVEIGKLSDAQRAALQRALSEEDDAEDQAGTEDEIDAETQES